MNSPHQQIRSTGFERREFEGLYVFDREDKWARPYNQPPPPGFVVDEVFTPSSYNEGLIPTLSKTVAYVHGLVGRLEVTRQAYANLLEPSCMGIGKVV